MKKSTMPGVQHITPLKQTDSLPSLARGETLRLTDVSFEVGEREVVWSTGGNGPRKSMVLKTFQKNRQLTK